MILVPWKGLLESVPKFITYDGEWLTNLGSSRVLNDRSYSQRKCWVSTSLAEIVELFPLSAWIERAVIFQLLRLWCRFLWCGLLTCGLLCSFLLDCSFLRRGWFRLCLLWICNSFRNLPTTTCGLLECIFACSGWLSLQKWTFCTLSTGCFLLFLISLGTSSHTAHTAALIGAYRANPCIRTYKLKSVLIFTSTYCFEASSKIPSGTTRDTSHKIEPCNARCTLYPVSPAWYWLDLQT